MSGHTPGPWTAQGPIVYRGGAQVAATYFYPLKQRLADAALIAAAPDLLAALKSAREQLQLYETAATGENYNDTQINAAIAKAEGR